MLIELCKPTYMSKGPAGIGTLDRAESKASSLGPTDSCYLLVAMAQTLGNNAESHDMPACAIGLLLNFALPGLCNEDS